MPFALINTELTKKNISRLINARDRRLVSRTRSALRVAAHVHGLPLRDARRTSIGIDDMKDSGREEAPSSKAAEKGRQGNPAAVPSRRWSPPANVPESSTSGRARTSTSPRGDDEGDRCLKSKKREGEVSVENKPRTNLLRHHGRLSRARVFAAQIRQLAGMRGLTAPVRTARSSRRRSRRISSVKASMFLHYFNSTDGVCKGLADTGVQDRQRVTSRVVSSTSRRTWSRPQLGIAALEPAVSTMTPIVEGRRRGRSLCAIACSDAWLRPYTASGRQTTRIRSS